MGIGLAAAVVILMISTLSVGLGWLAHGWLGEGSGESGQVANQTPSSAELQVERDRLCIEARQLDAAEESAYYAGQEDSGSGSFGGGLGGYDVRRYPLYKTAPEIQTLIDRYCS